jgi:hypothetical protein
MAGATEERKLLGVGSSAWLGSFPSETSQLKHPLSEKVSPYSTTEISYLKGSSRIDSRNASIFSSHDPCFVSALNRWAMSRIFM